jgi:hypothetical protein
MFAEIKAWFLAIFLKKYIQPDDRRPKRYPEPRCDIDEPRFIDRYFERTSDPKFVEIDEKVKQAVANLKAKGKF